MNFPNNIDEWKSNKNWRPIHIFSADPYIRLYTSWLWKNSKGYYGFFAWSKKYE